MKEIVKISVTLAIVAFVSALTLSGINVLTAPRIEENIRIQHQAILSEFFPEMGEATQQELDDVVYDVVFCQDDQLLGILARGEVEGYSGVITYYLVLTDDGEIGGISILSHTETPGIGTIIEEEHFHEQFYGIHYLEDVQIGENVDIVTGATISTEALIKSIDEVLTVVGKSVF